MGITAHLHDQARIIRTDKTSTRVEGGYQTQTVIGPWFRCHYDPGTEGEQKTPGSIRRRRAGASIIAAKNAKDGTPVELKAQDRLEIDSKGHGVLSLDVVATPEKLVKGRTVLGWQVQLGKSNREAPG